MNIVSKAEVKSLLETGEEPCISIYMPTHRAGTETQKDPIRLKNLLKAAEEKLGVYGLSVPEVQELLQSALDWIQVYRHFWQLQKDGLAIFIAPGQFRYYQLPIRFKELLVVSHRYHLKPLIRFLSGDGRYFILALSQNQVRMLQGSRYSINVIKLETVPTDIKMALKFDDPEKQLQFHTKTAARQGEWRAMFHGQSASSANKKNNLLRYFQKVDQSLQEVIGDEQVPMVFAGVDYLFPIYKEANSYPYLISESIGGNPEAKCDSELQKLAWNIVGPLFAQVRQEAQARYKSTSNTNLISNDISEILPAAYHGRVGTLFVAMGIQYWGNYDPDNNKLQLNQNPKAGDVDLLDTAALYALINGGTVYVVDSDRLPDFTPIAAVFRYEISEREEKMNERRSIHGQSRTAVE
jgi:hypothetical protein